MLTCIELSLYDERSITGRRQKASFARQIQIRGKERKSQGPEIAVEREDVFDTALVGEDAGRVVHERNLLVAIVRKLLCCRLEDGLT